jgi:dolichol-phosphate mannosyltransferase
MSTVATRVPLKLTNRMLPSLSRAGRTAVSVVVPCYNEEAALPSLAETLASVDASLSESYDLEFLIVDDGSTDRTWMLMNRLFGDRANFRLLRHEHNRGIAAAIRTGMSAARFEVVCSMDSDCTYDPHELQYMIPLLRDGVDMVTASPYHPLGRVENVPAWRLSLSKAASFLYRRVLRQKLYTYTSCFRVFRRSVALQLPAGENGFHGIGEMAACLDLQGSRIVEYPTTLAIRKLGYSKMKTFRATLGHLRLLARMLGRRLWHRAKPLPPFFDSDSGLPGRADSSAILNAPHLERTIA